MGTYTKIMAGALLCAILGIGGMWLATSNAATSTDDAASKSENNVFTGVVNWFKKGIKIGDQSTGGVTYFNGTITNNTKTKGKDNPVTIGDNLRVDGEIWRGATSGPGDSKPVKINDDLKIYGDVEGITTAMIDGLDTALDGKSSTSHNHDTSYVSKSSPSFDTQTGYIMLGGCDFVPITGAENYLMMENNGELYPAASSAEDKYLAPLNLPHGASITAMHFYYYDMSDTGYVTMYLQDFDNGGGTNNLATAASPTASAGGYGNTSVVMSNQTVNNSSHSYHLKAVFNATDQAANLRVTGVRITYTYTMPH